MPEGSKGEDLRSSGTMYLAGSNPVVVIACMPEWSKGPDSSSGVVILAGSNPASCTWLQIFLPPRGCNW